MHAIIIDDEKSGREALKALLKTHCPEIKVDYLASSAEDGRRAINSYNPDLVFLDIEMPRENGFKKLSISDIVYIGTDKKQGSASNNKVIYFRNRKPEILVDFSFVRMPQLGFDMSAFVQIHKSFIINKEHFISYDLHLKSIKVKVLSETASIEEIHLPVSDNYRSHLKV